MQHAWVQGGVKTHLEALQRVLGLLNRRRFAALKAAVNQASEGRDGWSGTLMG